MRGAGQNGYDRIGGEDTLVDVVDDLYERLLADPRLRAFFDGTPSAGATGRQQDDLTLVSAHLDDALHAAGVPGPTAEEIISVVAPLTPEIVSQPLTV